MRKGDSQKKKCCIRLTSSLNHLISVSFISSRLFFLKSLVFFKQWCTATLAHSSYLNKTNPSGKESNNILRVCTQKHWVLSLSIFFFFFLSWSLKAKEQRIMWMVVALRWSSDIPENQGRLRKLLGPSYLGKFEAFFFFFFQQIEFRSSYTGIPLFLLVFFCQLCQTFPKRLHPHSLSRYQSTKF